jgi:hypothetical protein
MKNSIKKMTYALVAVSAFASTSVMARNQISYNYASIQVIDQHLDDYNCSQDGLRLGGSLEVSSDFFVQGSYSDVSGNRCGSENLQVGLGYHTLFGADSSLYGVLGFENTSVDQGESDSGLYVGAGLRGFIHTNLEAKAQLAHHTVHDGNTVLSGGVAYWFLPTLSVTGDVGLGTETSEIAVGLRLNF